ncbi:hypothetical protein ACJ73_06214, partial [Blastomyces percursus]
MVGWVADLKRVRRGREGTEIGRIGGKRVWGGEGGRCREKHDLKMKLELGMAKWRDGEIEKRGDEEMRRWRDEKMKSWMLGD